MTWVDDDGVRVPLEQRAALDLELDGRRIWAFVPPRDGRRRGDEWLVPWPSLLQPYLDGQADVVLRDVSTGTPVHESSVALGSGEGRIEVVDRHGKPLTVDKGGHLSPAMFADAGDEERARLVEATAEVLAFLADRGHDAFLAYGNLLGAVRDGRLIGHDNDADVALLSRASHPVDVMLESFEAERAFVETGWATHRMSGADFKLLTTMPDGTQVGIDVFSAFYLDGTLHLLPTVAGDLPRSALLPTRPVRLEGRELPGPADPEALLEATYGPGWRTPDPAFKYEPPRWLRRRMSGLFRGERKNIAYWQGFYKTKADAVPTDPSSFARWVAGLEPRPRSLVDVGCGTGRDSVWLAGQGIDVLGCDYSSAGLSYAAGRARDEGVELSLRRLNLYDLRQSLTTGALLAQDRPTDAVYARFLVHALDEEGRRNLWRFSRMALRGTRGRLYLEFRTEATRHEFGEHFREFVQPEVVTAELEHYGFAVEHCENRYGLAVHKDEDPRVCRIVAKMEDRG